MAFETVVMSGVTTGSGIPINCAQERDLTAWVIGSGTISAGTLIFEEAYYNVTGPGTIIVPPATWSQLPNASIDLTQVTSNATKAYQFPPGKYSFVRPRLTANVTGGGSITVVLGGL